MEGKHMKRVYCLYRVSTKGQVDHNDIPMQRIECRKFAEQQGWTIVREEAELGVSGYKVSAKKRDKLQLMLVQQITAEAENQEQIAVKLGEYFDRFTSWAEEFDAAPIERKRMILSELFSRIELDRGYHVRFEVELDYRQVLEGVAPDIPFAV